MSVAALQFDHVYKTFHKGTLSPAIWRHLVPATKKASTSSQVFYALEDIQLDIQQGEVWGVVGNNGAGKSTLLKLAARILHPSRGVVRGNGKVSGILEVGAGFNFELTGRENIYISGYILGMTRTDVNLVMNDIIEFSGLKDFVDTPIKRYSSGMYLRLAFAVAAFLRTNIMVIDEVLAVGDAAFQQQCLNSINTTSKEKGTTVLFVSHNMFAVKQLCQKGVWLDHGIQKITGNIDQVINAYATALREEVLVRRWDDLQQAPGNETVRLSEIRMDPSYIDGETIIDVRTAMAVHIRFYCYADDIDINLGLHLKHVNGEWIFDAPSTAIKAKKGWMEATCFIPGNLLNNGNYFINLIFVKNLSGEIFLLQEALSFVVEDYRENTVWVDKWQGAIRPKLPFELHYAG